MRRFALLSLVLLSGCASVPDRRAATAEDLPPISDDFRERLASWAASFYGSRSALSGSLVSDPVPARDGNGRLLWLVCLDLPKVVAGEPPARQIQAFGFAPAYASTPLRRNGATLSRDDCLDRPLSWHAWSEPSVVASGSGRGRRTSLRQTARDFRPAR